MHRRWLTLLLLLCLMMAPAQAEEEAPGPDWMPPEAAAAMEAQWPGMRVLSASGTWPEVTSLLALVDTGTSKLACILALEDGRWQIQAVNDAIIDDGAWVPEAFWIGFGSEDKSNFIWYTPKDRPQDERYISFDKGPEPSADWAVMAGHFGPAGHYPELGFHNRDGVMWVRGECAAASILPHQLDMRFDAYDPQAVRLFTEWAYDMMDSFLQMIPSTGESDALPQGQYIDRFAKGQTWPVYSGPGKEYARLGEGKAAVSTNDWIQVFGREKGWLFIQYNISPGRNRFGWIEGKALPAGVSVPELRFTREEAVLPGPGWMTDDPLRTSAESHLPDNREAVILATMGEDWRYVELTYQGQLTRAFVPTLAVNPRSQYHGSATVRVAQTPLLDDRGKPIGRYFGGARLAVLAQREGQVQVRIGDERHGRSGWLALGDVMLDAAPMDVPVRPATAQLCLPDGQVARAYTAPDLAAVHAATRTAGLAWLGEVQGFVHVQTQSQAGEPQQFFPRDWLLTLPMDSLPYNQTQSMTLTRDCPVLLRPEPGAPSRMTLYEGVAIKGIDLGNGWFFTLDNQVVRDSGWGEDTFGYLPMNCLAQPAAQPAGIRIGLVQPLGEADVTWLYADRRDAQDGLCAWGECVLLVGESERYHLIRTAQGRYGYLPRGAVSITRDTCPQDDPARLFWGQAQLDFPGGDGERPIYTYPYPHRQGSVGHAVQNGTQLWLMANLGDWWHVAVNDQLAFFVPERWLSNTAEAPHYTGPYDQLRGLE